ncbi:MAG: K+/H+ antiporter subunit F [Pirellulaceae bacterium]|nr:K+/H+ antiporter subunit F [Pirellulaceae bacterium]
MIWGALVFGLTAAVAGLLMNSWRLAKGPDATDRILASDTMVVNTIALIILYGMLQGTTTYFESALLFAMFGFTSTVAYCRFLLRGDIIE